MSCLRASCERLRAEFELLGDAKCSSWARNKSVWISLFSYLVWSFSSSKRAKMSRTRGDISTAQRLDYGFMSIGVRIGIFDLIDLSLSVTRLPPLLIPRLSAIKSAISSLPFRQHHSDRNVLHQPPAGSQAPPDRFSDRPSKRIGRIRMGAVGWR
ncbi:hypothetical protein JAAARDRAFT_333373 [Jaapia argillacea MUCL 33604]|uniref:Uncharacterized protein n=1 Tax=Jaapia argillacea MUCL 33604 TaxID=933084 RepID=A0A067PVK4_9AGAM|nr:hypothetical protein JAAARDRAFT_333373 [Jaapia argillacea MUCL 33604]